MTKCLIIYKTIVIKNVIIFIIISKSKTMDFYYQLEIRCYFLNTTDVFHFKSTPWSGGFIVVLDDVLVN